MLDERKLKILAAVVDEYIVTGEPVSSKAIASMQNIKVSPATVRNDMAMLEQLGYLEQPHTSAGRIPTYSAYRLYIEKLMPQRQLTPEEKSRLDRAVDEVEVPTEDALTESASKALAELTNCTVVASNASPQFSLITKVEVIPTGRRMYVLLMITSSGSIKNKVCRLEFDLSDEQLRFFSGYVTENLSGMPVEHISDSVLDKLAEAMGAYMVTLSPLLKGVSDLAKGFRGGDVHLEGERNLLARKDLSPDEALRFIEEKDRLTMLLDDSFSSLQVLFGEDGNFIVSNSSVIMSPIRRGGKTLGSLGIIGPLRLNYAKVIPYIEYLTQRITEAISEDEPPAVGMMPDADDNDDKK